MTTPKEQGAGERPRLLDLFCGAGGCAKGYQRAGFYVVGVDINPQPNYCGDEFIQADALEFLDDLSHPYRQKRVLGWSIHDVAAVHSSPPCQGYSISKNNGSGKDAPKLIGEVRALLKATGLPYVIENVMGAGGFMENPVMICGAGLGLSASGMDLHRHRLFETNFPLMGIPCTRHHSLSMGVYGNGTNAWHRKKLGRNLTVDEMREAMGIDWMPRATLNQAIPPAYCEHIGTALLHHLAHLKAAA